MARNASHCLKGDNYNLSPIFDRSNILVEGDEPIATWLTVLQWNFHIVDLTKCLKRKDDSKDAPLDWSFTHSKNLLQFDRWPIERNVRNPKAHRCWRRFLWEEEKRGWWFEGWRWKAYLNGRSKCRARFRRWGRKAKHCRYWSWWQEEISLSRKPSVFIDPRRRTRRARLKDPSERDEVQRKRSPDRPSGWESLVRASQ